MNDSLPTSGGPAPSGVSRRTVVKGAAWAVPVVTLAGAAPAFAGASQEECLSVAVSDDTCKYSGNSNDNEPKAYYLRLCFTNSCNTPILNVRVTRVQNNSGAILFNTPAMVALDYLTFGPFDVPAKKGTVNGTACTELKLGYTSNSAGTLTVYYTIDGGTQTFSLTTPSGPQDCPPSPTGLTAAWSGVDTAYLNWDDVTPSSAVDGWYVQYRQSGTTDWSAPPLNVTVSEATIALGDSLSWEFRVQAYKLTRLSTWSYVNLV